MGCGALSVGSVPGEMGCGGGRWEHDMGIEALEAMLMDMMDLEGNRSCWRTALPPQIQIVDAATVMEMDQGGLLLDPGNLLVFLCMRHVML
ncbi:hypothetical protein NC651_028210 [Populus alba x Populus x berolinensis]|nr:hypothetical protein NC651_028210 [Populus alba x Populus x berolinensis]